MKTQAGMSAFWIKIIAMSGMLIDHIHTHFYFQTPFWLSFFGPFVAPVFTYFLVEGFFLTHNRRKYCIRLYVAGAVMAGGSYVVNLFLKQKGIYIANNIFMTLAVMFSVLWMLETIRTECRKNKKIYWLVLPVLLLSTASLFLEGGVYLLPFALITYYFYGDKKKQIMGYLVLCGFLFLETVISYNQVYAAYESFIQFLAFSRESLIITAVPFICLYNGSRGYSGKWAKWMFYVFYPVHLWIIGILEYYIVGAM